VSVAVSLLQSLHVPVKEYATELLINAELVCTAAKTPAKAIAAVRSPERNWQL
jgi:hypothetical protein